jgi:hypothetical protein
MATREELKTIAKERLKVVKILINAKDWHGAAYMMAWSLECALKAMVYKTLHQISYPAETKKGDIDKYFMTHKFDNLLLVSGLQNIFSPQGPVDAYRNWSDFTKEFQGDWPSIRYDISQVIWDGPKIKRMYTYLNDPNGGVVTEIKKRW